MKVKSQAEVLAFGVYIYIYIYTYTYASIYSGMPRLKAKDLMDLIRRSSFVEAAKRLSTYMGGVRAAVL